MKTRGTSLLHLGLIVVLSSCAGIVVLQTKAQSSQGESHTIAYLHGRIYTNDPEHPWADAMAIRADPRPRRVALLLGTEGRGLSGDALALADLHVRIPMAPEMDSLNVATAGAIALHWLSSKTSSPSRREP